MPVRFRSSSFVALFLCSSDKVNVIGEVTVVNFYPVWWEGNLRGCDDPLHLFLEFAQWPVELSV